MDTLTGYQIDLIRRLRIYELAFEATYAKNPDTRESVADHNARFDSGLTETGLCTARAYAGKYATTRPGVVCYLDGTWGVVAAI